MLQKQCLAPELLKLLAGLSAIPQLEGFYLVGGTCLFSIPDIAAAKISAVTNRGSKKDFYDLYELLKQFTLTQLMDFFSKKFTGISSFMALKSLTWFEDAEEEPDPVMLYPLEWEEVKTKVISAVKSMS